MYLEGGGGVGVGGGGAQGFLNPEVAPRISKVHMYVYTHVCIYCACVNTHVGTCNNTKVLEHILD